MAGSSKKVIIAALTGNSLIAVTKFVASFITGSSAMLSEGIHSVVDTGNQILLLYGLNRSKKPADEDFPFGHGKEIYFWSFVVAILVFAVGAGVSVYEGIHHILEPQPMKNPMVNYVVLALALCFEGAAWLFALKEFSKTKGKKGYIDAVKTGKDPTIFVVLFEDSAALLGLVIAFAGVLLSQTTGLAYFDGIASVLIGLLLGGTAVWLAYETKGLLIGERANRPVIDGIREIVNSCKEVEHINEVLTMHMGPEFILVNLSVDFVDSASAAQIENIVAEIDGQIKAAFPLVKRIFIEGEARHLRNSQTATTTPT
ncbi:MAG: cation diffusion facilitator family transporter [Gammaproteobacteria bacterium]